MSILRRLLGTEQRNVSGGQWLSDKPAESSAGVQLNQQNATSIGALYAAVKLYADTVASLPVGAFIRDGADIERLPELIASLWERWSVL